MSETGEDETRQVSAIIDGIDPYTDVHHDGVVTERGQFGSKGRNPGPGIYRHPPLACSAPRYPSTMRGFYRCPACGVKVTLAGQVRASELGQELGERWAEAIAGGVAQAFWYTIDLIATVGQGLRAACKWLKNRHEKAQDSARVAPQMVHALVIMGMVAARYRSVGGEKMTEK
jgi:hypothetical protein